MEKPFQNRSSFFVLACAMTLAINAYDGFGQSYDSLPNQPDYYNKQAARFLTQKANKGSIVFLGNSITEGGNWKVLLNDSLVINRGISGDSTFGVLQRLDEVIQHQPSKIFLMIGINDLSKDIPNAVIIQNIFSIIGRIHGESPKTEVFVQSLLPVNPGHKNFPQRFKKGADIIEINGQLKKYREILKYTYLDVYTHFLDDRLLLDLRYTTDGLHLNQSGYVHWVDFLKKQKCL